MLQFMKDYCVEAADDFLPSKLLNHQDRFKIIAQLTHVSGLCAAVFINRNRDTLFLLLHWKHYGEQSERISLEEPESE